MTVAHYLGLTPKWVDGTAVGGCSFMIHVRHVGAAIASGLCKTVLITDGESGRSGVGHTRNVVAPHDSRAVLHEAVNQTATFSSSNQGRE